MRPSLARLASVAVAPLLLLGASALHAHRRWQPIGTTNVGNPVEIDTRGLKRANGIITATLRTKFVKPAKVPGGVVSVSHTIISVDCAKHLVAIPDNIYYIDEAKNVVYQRSTAKIPGFSPPMGGSAPEVGVTFLCKR